MMTVFFVNKTQIKIELENIVKHCAMTYGQKKIQNLQNDGFCKKTEFYPKV